MMKMMMKTLMFVCALPVMAFAAVTVDVNFNVKHSVNGVSELDRETYFVLHASAGENTWGSDAQETAFLNDYDVYLGRSNGTLPWNLSQTTEDPAKPGWCSHANMLSRGNSARSSYAADTHAQSLESRAAKMMIGGQMDMLYPVGENNAKGFTVSEHAALADFYEYFLTYFYGTGGTSGQPKPAMIEVVNEPFVAASSHNTTRENISALHTNVAAAIHNSHPDVMVGGYCAAHPAYEGNDGDFSHWDGNWKTFIDIAGADMDFFSLHLYDNPAGSTNVLETQYRSGSNVEALLDMIEHYSMLTLGEIKPFNISEFGSLSVTSDIPYDPRHDWVDVRSYSTILMQLLERPDHMIQTIPFMMVQAEWGRSANGYPYPTRLLYDEDELLGYPKDKDGPFVFTQRIKFWELWKEVNGTRVDTFASDPDIQVNAYVDGADAFVIVSSLDHTGSQTVDLNLFGSSQTPQQIMVKHTYQAADGMPTLDQYTTSSLPSITLPPSSTVVIKYTFANPVSIDHESAETKYYATTYLQPIVSGTPIEFEINNVALTQPYGEAVLRLGIGRAHGLSLHPQLTFNGVPVTVPTDWRGYDQLTRDSFYGVLEIPVPYYLLQENNDVVVTFGDSGGNVASVAMQVFSMDVDLRNSSGLLPIASGRVENGHVILGITNGMPNGYFALQTRTNLMTGDWVISQTGIPVDGFGGGTVTNSAVPPTQFFRIRSSGPPPVLVSGFSLFPDSDTVSVGGTCRLPYTVLPIDATDKSVIWTSGNPAVATVSNGIVTGVANGSTVITGETSDGGFTDSSTITVGSTTAQVWFDDVNKYRNQTFTNGTAMKVRCTYDAGTGHTVNSVSGVSYKLRQIDSSSGSWQVVKDFNATDPGAVGTQSGGSQAEILIPGDITPTAYLPANNFYYLFVSIDSTDGSSYSRGTNPILIVNPNLEIVEFTAPDYADGTLNGQQNWNAESGWTVADSAGVGNASTPDSSSAAVLNDPIQLSAGETYSLSINLQFGGTYAMPTSYEYIFLGGLKGSSAGASVGTGDVAADANIQLYLNDTKYRLLNNYSNISGCSVIAGTLDGGDVLQFDYELTMGSDAASTIYTVRLQNLTDGTDTGTGTVLGVDASVYNALSGSGAYGFFQSIIPGLNGSGLSGVQVNSVTTNISQ